MQKLRNYVKSSSRAINWFMCFFFYFPSALPRARQLIAMTLRVILVISGRWPRGSWPPTCAATKIGRGCADGDHVGPRDRGSVRETCRFDYVAVKDMRDRRDYVIETRRTSRFHWSMCRRATRHRVWYRARYTLCEIPFSNPSSCPETISEVSWSSGNQKTRVSKRLAEELEARTRDISKYLPKKFWQVRATFINPLIRELKLITSAIPAHRAI